MLLRRCTFDGGVVWLTEIDEFESKFFESHDIAWFEVEVSYFVLLQIPQSLPNHEDSVKFSIEREDVPVNFHIVTQIGRVDEID